LDAAAREDETENENGHDMNGHDMNDVDAAETPAVGERPTTGLGWAVLIAEALNGEGAAGGVTDGAADDMNVVGGTPNGGERGAGEPWKATDGYMSSKGDATIHGPDGMSLHVMMDEYPDKGKIVVTGKFPKDTRQFRDYDAVTHRASAGLNTRTHPLPRIVAAIRAFLPAYRVELEQVAVAKMNHDAIVVAAQGVAEALAETLGGKVYTARSGDDTGRNGYAYLVGYRDVEYKVRDNDVKFTGLELSHEMALELAAWLRAQGVCQE